MTTPSLLLAGVASLLALTATDPAAALGMQEIESIKLFGGTYSTDCGNLAAPRVRVAEKLTVEQGNKRMTGDNLMAAYSYLGPEPPPGHQVALLSEVRRDARLIFLVTRDKNGLYVELMGEDPKVETALIAVLGRAQYKAKYRDCDVASRAPLPQATQAAPASPDSVASWDYVRDKKFQALYRKALGPKASTPWVARLDGPSSGAKAVNAAGADYRQLAVCKPHDCGDNNLVLLYSPSDKTVFGKIVERGRSTLIGKPSPALSAELERLWKAEWRQAN